MAYTLDAALILGAGQTGLTDLRAQLVDTAGSDSGAAISTGFVEIGTSGSYLWHYAAFPDAHRGGVKFYSLAASSVILAFAAINPEEAENVDAKVTTRATPAQVNAEVLDVLTVDTFAEPAAVPAATSTLKDKILWLFALARNRITQTATTQTLRNDANDADVATAAVSDDGTTFVRDEWAT